MAGQRQHALRSFLKSDEARKRLCGKPFAVFVLCRMSWRKTSKRVLELAEEQRERNVGEIHFT
jgi:hypothetical protein